MFAYMKLLKKEKPDVIHCQMARIVPACAIAAKLASPKPKVFYHARGLDPETYPKIANGLADNLLTTLADQCRHERHGETQPHPAGSARPGQAPAYETEQHREGVGRDAHAVVGDRVAHVHGDVDGRAHDDHQPDDQPQEDQLLADAPRIATTVAGRRAHLLSSSDAPPMRDL